MSTSTTLRDALLEWTDVDHAQYALAVVLGAIDPDHTSFATEAKAVFWTDNRLGNALYATLRALVAAGVLEARDEPDLQFRRNPGFVGPGS